MARAFVTAALLTMALSATARSSGTSNPATAFKPITEVKRDDLSGTTISVKAEALAVRQVISSGSMYERSLLTGEATISQPGWPDLPAVTRMLRIPPTTGVRLQVNRVQTDVEAGHQPFIAPLQDGTVDPDQPGEPKAEFLNWQGYWPPQPVEVGAPVIIRGVRIVPVTVFPVQYNPATGETRFNTEVDFELIYEGEGENPVLHPDRIPSSETFQPIYESLLINPPPRRDNYDRPQRGALLIIYPDTRNVAEAIAPLVEWRARQGWDVHTEVVDDNANTNDVKDVIEAAYNDWNNPVEFVTLVGDADGSVRIATYQPEQYGSDLDYVHLDGNDILADAHIGRISVASVNQLEDVVAKLVNYEADPWLEDTDWYKAGMVCAGNSISGLSTILMNKWVARELTDRGIDDIHEWYYNDQFENQSVLQFFESEFERGVAFANYRGWIGLEGTTYDVIMWFEEHQRYPVTVTLTCASGNFANGSNGQNEAFLRSPGGGICGVGLATSNTHVQYNNAVSAGIWIGLLKQEHHLLGPAINYGRYELYRQYNGFDNGAVGDFSHWTAFMGDPVTHIWTGVPQLMTVYHEDSLPLGGSGLEVEVLDSDDAPFPRALVCLFKADDEFQQTAYTDGDGKVLFSIPPGGLSQGQLMVTVTSHDYKPYLGTVDVEQAEYYLGAGGWEYEDGEDGTPNPGEDLDVTVYLKNLGTAVPEGQITVTAESLSDWVEVTSQPVTIEEAPDVGSEAAVPVEITLEESAPNGEIVLIGLESSNGEQSWSSVMALEVAAPKLQIVDVSFEREIFTPGDIVQLNVLVKNIGGKGIAPFLAHMRGLAPVVSFPTADADYDALEVGESEWVDGAEFRIRAHPLTIPGMEVSVELAAESETGFRDTTTYSFQVSQAGEGTPFGPDKYGYVCFDSEDEGWEVIPVYDWVEIDPEEAGFDFEGEDTELRDTGEDRDESIMVNLGFDFQYYGQTFDQLTICTNGWAAFGNWQQLSDFRNRRIASGEGPNAQLAVFWDNLRTDNDSRILYYYDQPGGRFIVEWKNMDRLWGGNRRSETFELILFENWAEPTYTGDGVIIYQYQSVHNAQGTDTGNNDTPYATVGIGNLDDTDGLEYTYWNEYTDGAAPLDSGLAIKFTSATQFRTGILTGSVTDAATGLLLEGVQVYTTHGFWGETDSAGVYAISDILIGEGYIVTAHLQGYNDSTRAGEDGHGYTIIEGETTRVDFNLLHPEFFLDSAAFDFRIPPDTTVETGFTLTNTGNGPLNYASEFVYLLDGQQGVRQPPSGAGPLRKVRRDEPDNLWEQLLGWSVTSVTGDNAVRGVAYVNEHWLVAGTGFNYNEDEDHPLHLYDRWGNYEQDTLQPRSYRFGLKDLEAFQGQVYGATQSNYLLRFDPESYEVTGRWSVAENIRSTEALALSTNGEIFTSGGIGKIYRYEILDESTLWAVDSLVANDPQTGAGIRKYGMAWFRDDPDQCPLYIMGALEDLSSEVQLFKMNPETGQIIWLTDLGLGAQGYKGRGIFITPKWNNMVWVMGVVLEAEGGSDEIAVYELGPNSSWLGYGPQEGMLQTGQSQFFSMTIATAGLDTGLYGVVIAFTHNADDGGERLPVDLEVGYPRLLPADITSPFEYALEPNRPNPFNPTTVIGYRLREAGITELKLYDLQGRLATVLQDGWQQAGNHRLTLDASQLPAGIYIYRLESGPFKAARKMVLVK